MDPTSYVSSLVGFFCKSMIEEVKFLEAVKGEVEELQTEIQWMLSFIEDAEHHIHVEEQSQRHQSRVFRQWVSQIKEASLDAEDIIDTYEAKLALRERSGGILNYIKNISCMWQKDIHTVGLEIQALKSRLSSLRKRSKTYISIKELRSEAAAQPLQRRTNYAHILNRCVVGLDRKIEEVVDLLLNENERCKVVSIYGKGGSGKTTLAKEVYQNDKIRSRFDKFVWVSVSQQFEARDIWESMLTQLTFEDRSEIAKMKYDMLAAKLCEVQKVHKCFILLDDICSIQDWNKLSLAFNLKGESKMVITTHKEEVANHVDPKGRYGELELLSEEQGMELLTMIAMRGRNLDITDQERTRMEQLARNMLQYCGRLPTVICVLAGILVTKNSLREWEIVHANIGTSIHRGEEHNDISLGVHDVFSYSYYDLPHQLKCCFRYLSQFPEDYEIQTNRLLKMWIAEDFVSVEYNGHEEEEIEDTAERYLNELVGRCMVQVGKKGSTGRIKTCRTHDLMRDMCLLEAKKENTIHMSFVGGENEKSEYWSRRKAVSMNKIRRVSFILDPGFEAPLFERNSQLRTLILQSKTSRCQEINLKPEHKAKNFKLLRMLVLEGIESDRKNLPKQIGNLVHLRYFSMRNSSLYAFPPLEKLKWLETLDLRGKCKKPSLSNSIWMLKHLRHLYLPYDRGCYSMKNVQIGNSNPNMQTLVNFPPRDWDVNEVAKFPNVRKLQLVKEIEFGEIFRSKQAEFCRLSSLSVHPQCGCKIVDLEGILTNVDEECGCKKLVDLEGILTRCPNIYKLRLHGPLLKFSREVSQLAKKLTKLIIEGSFIEDLEGITILGMLPNLKILHLERDAYKGRELWFQRGSFLQLKSLRLWGLPNLEVWWVDEGAMPILQSLQIDKCDELWMVPEGLRFIHTLKELHIISMPENFTKRVKEGGPHFDKFQRIPTILITK